MSITLPAIRKGDTLMLLQHLEGIPEGAPVSVTITTESEREAWYRAGDAHFDTVFGDDDHEELLKFSGSSLNLAYGPDEPDYSKVAILPDDDEE
jgi:hypothetical protein